MALINCTECNKEISDTAKQCPHCGAENKQNKLSFLGWIFVLIACFPILLVLVAIFQPKEGYTPPKSKDELIKEQIDMFASRCKDGYASDCDNERNLTKIYNASKR